MAVEMVLPYSLITQSPTDRVLRVLNAALSAADPVQAVINHVQLADNMLLIDSKRYNLAEFERIYLVGFGKAAVGMGRGLTLILGDRITAGVLIVKHLPSAMEDRLPDCIEVLQGSHPVPDERSIRSTKRLIELLEAAGEKDLVICLISGGGSALLTDPVEGVNLKHLQTLTQQLLTCGAEIGEINTLRKHLDWVKGGGLARLAYPAHLVALVLSDVIGSPLDVIASGPTVADPSTYDQALAILHRYRLRGKVPEIIFSVLENGQEGRLPETVKEGDPCLERSHTVVVSSNYQAALAALKAAQQQGFNAMLLTTYLSGEARQAGIFLAGIGRQIVTSGHPLARPACVIAGGETTVTVQGNGVGGRNQEVALAAALGLSGLSDVLLVTLATDGEDGPTNAAGAAVSGATQQRAKAAALDAKEYLRRNDSYHFFSVLGDLLITGPTGTNVNDLTFLFVF